MKTVEVNGVDLAYEMRGAGLCDLLFVHGYAVRSTGNMYAPLYGHLAPHFRIVALDLRGHGGSAGVTESFTLDQLAADIAAVCQALQLDKPLFTGHSLGGLMGLLSELKQPGTFRGLVMLAPAAATGGKGASADVIGRALRDHRNKQAMRNHYRPMYVRDVSEADLDNIVDTACLVDPAVHERYLTVEFPNVDITGCLSEIAPPVLFLNGTLDNVIPLEAQHQTTLGLPHFKEIIFSDEGHMLPLESPERIAREIIHFYQYDLDRK